MRFALLTWKNRINVPRSNPIYQCVDKQKSDGRAEVVGISLHRAGGPVVPLDAHALFLIQGKILATKTKRYWRKQALQQRREESKNNKISNIPVAALFASKNTESLHAEKQTFYFSYLLHVSPTALSDAC